VVERTVGGLTLREDEGVLTIDEAKLQCSKEGDEIFVWATMKGPAEHRNCFLMKGSTWLATKRVIESRDLSDAPAVPMGFWADPLLTEKFSSGDVYAVSFREDPEHKGETPDPRDTPFYVLCYKDKSIAGEDPSSTTWYDVAHVEGTPKVS
jgi:hypothetical protein